MRSHLLSLGVGFVLLVVGVVLWLTTGDVQTPVVTLTKVGVVLAVLGVVEIAVSGFALLSRSSRT